MVVRGVSLCKNPEIPSFLEEGSQMTSFDRTHVEGLAPLSDKLLFLSKAAFLWFEKGLLH